MVNAADLRIALKSEYPLVISFAYAQIALFNYWLDNFKNYEKFTAKAMEVAKSAGNKFHIALQKTAIARIKSRNRDYQEAIVLFDEAFVLSKEMR